MLWTSLVHRRHIAVHSDLVVDDIDAYLDDLRGMGARDEVLEQQRERLEALEERTIRTGFVSPYEPEVAP